MSLITDRTVLLPIDMQRAFDGPQWPRRWNREADCNGLALLAAWRDAARPIIHVRHDSVEAGSTLAPGQAGNAFRPGFEPFPGEPLVAKSVNSAFIGTDLDLRLRRLGADKVVVFGISTDMCVSTTIRTGANMGWAMVLVPDACDCFELPDGRGGVIPAEQVQAAHVATLAFEFCATALAAELAPSARPA
ncbi:MAG TPA: cysteine hydrolase family protein [Allosphingosinicella sp.]|nr:cysteine hydrolase family protein [Allosphingosinicella sp.]